MTISDMLKSWFDDELKTQKSNLKKNQEATNFSDITNYKELVEMRQELVKICEKYQKNN